jgi:hypothetical protein
MTCCAGIPADLNFQNIQESRLVSFFGRVNYNLNDRYLLVRDPATVPRPAAG